jgi:hypothetical protein
MNRNRQHQQVRILGHRRRNVSLTGKDDHSEVISAWFDVGSVEIESTGYALVRVYVMVSSAVVAVDDGGEDGTDDAETGVRLEARRGEVTFVFLTMAHKVETSSFEGSDLNHDYRDNHHFLKSLRADKHGSLPPLYIAWQLSSCRTSRFRAPTAAQPGLPYVIALTGMSQELLADSCYARMVWLNSLFYAQLYPLSAW